ncbi:MAG: hypothetical protein KGL39_32900, partial [Patescibacteria group bacterium]|nr:hypothetical protein [Patescibacteria group bacterium]
AVRYLQLHDTATALSGGEVPKYSFPIPAGTATAPAIQKFEQNFFTDAGISFTTGITFAISTTYATFTDSATASEHVVVAHYV